MTDIQQKADEAIDSVLNIERATPNPFFYTRLQARMMKKERNIWEKLSSTIARPAFAVMSISLVVLLNTFVVLTESSRTEQAEPSEVAVADEYSRTTSFYDLENVVP